MKPAFTPKRRLASWLDAFNHYMEPKGSPPLFTLWSAIVTIAGALERKVWVETGKGALYSNLYVVVVGPPGVGKTIATADARDLFRNLPDHKLGETDISRASLIDSLRDADRRLVKPEQTPGVVHFNALTIISDELGVLLPQYDNSFMNALTNLYDCRVYSERKRHQKDGPLVIENPILNLLAATTPAYLNNLLPEGAWDEGFMSRVVNVYAGESEVQDLWHTPDGNLLLRDDLINDLKIIGNLYGRMTFDEEAAQAIGKWHIEKGPPRPDHPKLIYYNTRRIVHLLKLCMIVSAAQSDSLIVTMQHYQTALAILLQTEFYMPDIFKAMKSGGDSRVMKEAWYFAYEKYLKSRKPIPLRDLMLFLSERTPAHNMQRLIEVMTSAGILEEKIEPGIGRCFVPRGQTPA